MFVLIAEIIPAGSGIGDKVTIPDMKIVPFRDADIVMSPPHNAPPLILIVLKGPCRSQALFALVQKSPPPPLAP